MELGEPVAAAPGEVRVAEDHPAAGGGRLLADRGGVGAERRVRVLAERGEQLLALRHIGRSRGEPGGHRHLRQAGVGGRRGRRVGDLRDEHPGRGQQVGGVDGVPDVLGRRVRPDPARALAGGVGDPLRPADVAEVGVDPGGVALHHRAGLPARPGDRVGEQLLHHAPVADVGEEGVALQVGRVERHVVGVARVGPEEPRALAAGGEHRVGEVADAGLRGGVALAVAERAPVVGLDVRDPVPGAGDLRAVGAALRRRPRGRGRPGGRGARRTGERRHRHEAGHQDEGGEGCEGASEGHAGPSRGGRHLLQRRELERVTVRKFGAAGRGYVGSGRPRRDSWTWAARS